MTDTQQKGIGALAVVLIIAAVVAVGGVGFYALNGRAPQVVTSSPTTAVTQDESPTAGVTGMADGLRAHVIKISGKNFRFNPSAITVSKGEKVEIELTSEDMMHDFVIDALGVKSPIAKSGETVTVEFTPTKVGTFQYYCSVGNHKAMGMVGTLTVK